MSAAPAEKDRATVVRTVSPDGRILYRLPSARWLALKRAAVLDLVLFAVPSLIFLLLVPLALLPDALPALGLLLSLLLAVTFSLPAWRLHRLLNSPNTLCGLEIGPEVLIVTRRVGPFRRSRLRPISSIVDLVIHQGAREVELRIISAESPDLWLAPGLPLEGLQSFARELAEELSRRDREALIPVREESVPAVGEHGQPAGSGILAVERGGGLSITIPALRRNSRQGIVILAVFGAIYLGSSVCYTAWGLLQVLARPTGLISFSRALEELPGYAVNWLVGAALLGVALHYGSRRIVVTVAPHGLQVEVVTLFRERRWSWSWGQIAEVRGSEKGFFVRPVQGKPLRLYWMASSNAEYRWLAETVRKAWKQGGCDDAAHEKAR